MAFPALFFGHGNPMNALLENSYTKAWRKIGNTLHRPKAILSISAHWYLPGAAVTINTNPRTIHDFGGFPEELYNVKYPAPGDPALARRVQELLRPLPVAVDDRWGLDHGTWSVLRHVYPDANVAVVQLSIDETQAPSSHFDLGQRLAPLREEEVLILGSGNLVHNLHTYAWGRKDQKPFDWAVSFESKAREMINSNKINPLIKYEAIGSDALLSIPTPEHFLPLLYVLGTRQERDTVQYPVEGVDGGSVSMLAVQVG